MEQTPFDIQQEHSLSKPERKSSRLWFWLALALILLTAGGFGVNHWMQVKAEEQRLAALRDQIKQIVLADNALALEVLEIDESSQITFAEFFKRTEKNKEERDALVRRLRAIEAGPYTDQANDFVRLMEIESDYVRSEEAVSRQMMEVSSRSDAMEALRTTVSSVTKDLDQAHDKYMAAPYGNDYGEKVQLDYARSRFETTEAQAKETWKAYEKATKELKGKLSTASLAADNWLKAEPKMYPSLAPARDVVSLLVKRKAKYRSDVQPSEGEKSAKVDVKESNDKSAAALPAASPLKETSTTTPSPVSTVSPTPTSTPSAPTRVKSTKALSGERFPATRLKEVGADEISVLSDDDLRYAINEMYARYGMTFKSKELQRSFQASDWYRPNERWTPAQVESAFTKTEKANLKVLIQERTMRRSSY